MNTKKRINISPDLETSLAVIQAAKRDKVPVATKAAELLRSALELEEDLILGAEAGRREKQKGSYLSHEEVWE